MQFQASSAGDILAFLEPEVFALAQTLESVCGQALILLSHLLDCLK
jgi:hypothetical protein